MPGKVKREALNVIAVALAGLVLVACAAPQTRNDQPPTATDQPPATSTRPPATNPGALTYRRAGGIQGIEEVYTIYEDGRVLDKEGNELENQAELAPLLFQDVADLGFYEMAPSYLPKDICCDRFIYEITVRDNGREHTVTTIDDAPDEPPELKLLRSKIIFVLFRE